MFAFTHMRSPLHLHLADIILMFILLKRLFFIKNYWKWLLPSYSIILQ